MTIDEAIEYCMYVCENINSCDNCVADHERLAESLKDLKGYINKVKTLTPRPPIIEYSAEIPSTHKYGRLLRFHCPNCGKEIVAMYEYDRSLGGGISKELKGCSQCLQAIDFCGYYQI